MPDYTPRWIETDPYGKDQRLDHLPAGPDYAADIWPNLDTTTWSVEIQHYTMEECGWERDTVAVFDAASEQEAKAWAEAWTPEDN